MAEFIYVLKTFAFAIVLVLALQIKINNQTLEEKSLNWVYESSAGMYLTNVAEGGVRVIQDGISKVKSQFSSDIGKHKSDKVGHRAEKFKIERSSGVVTEDYLEAE